VTFGHYPDDTKLGQMRAELTTQALRPGVAPVAKHESEEHAAAIPADRVIDNSGDMAQLLVEVESAWVSPGASASLPA
jgi:hypothetical protein